MECFLVSVHLFDEWVDEGDEYFCAVVVDLEDGLRGVVDDLLEGAYVSMVAVDDVESDDFVVVEFVAVEFREQGEGEVEVFP